MAEVPEIARRDNDDSAGRALESINRGLQGGMQAISEQQIRAKENLLKQLEQIKSTAGGISANIQQSSIPIIAAASVISDAVTNEIDDSLVNDFAKIYQSSAALGLSIADKSPDYSKLYYVITPTTPDPNGNCIFDVQYAHAEGQPYTNPFGGQVIGPVPDCDNAKNEVLRLYPSAYIIREKCGEDYFTFGIPLGSDTICPASGGVVTVPITPDPPIPPTPDPPIPPVITDPPTGTPNPCCEGTIKVQLQDSSCCDYPVDLDQPHAFLWAGDSDDWRNRMNNFYGGILTGMIANQTMEQIELESRTQGSIEE